MEDKYASWYNEQGESYYTTEGRDERIDKDHDEYIEGFRKVYEENPSYYESPEAFRKNMPLTKENFVWIKGGEDSWGEVSQDTCTAEVTEGIYAALEKMGGFGRRSSSAYAGLGYTNKRGRLIKESKVGWIKRMARGILSKVNKRIK
jgi:hypothetical protein